MFLLVDGRQSRYKEPSAERRRGCDIDLGNLDLNIFGYACKSLPSGSEIFAGRAPWSKAIIKRKNFIRTAASEMSHQQRKNSATFQKTSFPAISSRRTTPRLHYVKGGEGGCIIGPLIHTHNSIIHSPCSMRCQLSSSSSISLPPGCSPACVGDCANAVCARSTAMTHDTATRCDFRCI